MNKKQAEDIIGEIETEYEELVEAIETVYVDKDIIREMIKKVDNSKCGCAGGCEHCCEENAIFYLKELLK